MDRAEFERLLFAYRDACEYGGPRSDKAKRIFAALLDYVARKPEVPVDSYDDNGNYTGSQPDAEPVGWANRSQYGNWTRPVKSADKARQLAEDEGMMFRLQFPEVAVPLYRHPAPSGGDGVAELPEWMTEEWKLELNGLATEWYEGGLSTSKKNWERLLAFIARTAPLTVAPEDAKKVVQQTITMLRRDVNDYWADKLLAAHNQIVTLPEPSEWDLDWNEYIKAERDYVTIKPYLDWKTIDLNRGQALQFAAALIATAKDGK